MGVEVGVAVAVGVGVRVGVAVGTARLAVIVWLEAITKLQEFAGAPWHKLDALDHPIKMFPFGDDAVKLTLLLAFT